MLVRRLSFLVVFLLLALQVASAQNVFRVRIDTMTLKGGDTVTLNVYYTFNSTKPHNLNGFVARFLFDSNLVKIVGYSTTGTASDGLMTTESHRGLAAIGTSEINLQNPVLFKMRVAASRTLADTAWIHWDPDWPMFTSEAGVDTVIRTDGWVRTAVATGHTALSTPRRSVSGVITGPYADSVAFDLPVMISDIGNANVKSAQLQFKYDPNRLAFIDATTTSKSASILLSMVMSDTVTIVYQAVNGATILGNDTLSILHFYALVGGDTACTMLTNVRWTPLNADAKLGSTDEMFDSICLYGRYEQAFVNSDMQQQPFRLYPNPARDFVVSTGSDATSLKVYDALGRLVAQCERSGAVWIFPGSLGSGMYRAVLEGRNGELKASSLIIERQP